jgi:hypothetical protein
MVLDRWVNDNNPDGFGDSANRFIVRTTMTDRASTRSSEVSDPLCDEFLETIGRITTKAARHGP